MTFVPTPEQAEQLVKMRTLRTQAYVAFASACMEYDTANHRFQEARGNKRSALSAVDEINDTIATMIEGWATAQGIHEKIELDLNALP